MKPIDNRPPDFSSASEDRIKYIYLFGHKGESAHFLHRMGDAVEKRALHILNPFNAHPYLGVTVGSNMIPKDYTRHNKTGAFSYLDAMNDLKMLSEVPEDEREAYFQNLAHAGVHFVKSVLVSDEIKRKYEPNENVLIKGKKGMPILPHNHVINSLEHFFKEHPYIWPLHPDTFLVIHIALEEPLRGYVPDGGFSEKEYELSAFTAAVGYAQTKMVSLIEKVEGKLKGKRKHMIRDQVLLLALQWYIEGGSELPFYLLTQHEQVSSTGRM